MKCMVNLYTGKALGKWEITEDIDDQYYSIHLVKIWGRIVHTNHDNRQIFDDRLYIRIPELQSRNETFKQNYG